LLQFIPILSFFAELSLANEFLTKKKRNKLDFKPFDKELISKNSFLRFLISFAFLVKVSKENSPTLFQFKPGD
jgi:hypothetical protein